MRICSISLFIALFVWGPFVWADDSQTIEVIVIKKDCLITICKKYLENPGKWRKIAQLNRLSNPGLIFPNQKLIFPVDLLRGTPIEGEVTFIKGNVMTQERESGVWRALHLNERVGRGSGLKTGDEGTIEVTFEDKAAFLLRPNTTLKINKAARKGPSNIIRELYLRSGRTISKLKEATGRSSQFEIHSPSAIIATRGTVFRVWVDDQAETRSEVLKGVVGVEAMKQTVEVNEGEGTLVRANEAPQRPRKLLSAPGLIDAKSIYKTIPLKFRSGEIEGASSFRGMLSRDSDFKDVIYDQVVKPGEIIEIAGIDDGAYFFQIQSVDSEGLEGLPSAPLSVKVRVNPLPPYIQTPLESAEYRQNTVEFKWLKVKDAVRYHLQVAEDREFSSLVIDKDTIKDTEYTAASLGVKTYFFRVSSIAEDDYEGAASDVLSFTIIPPPPSVEKPEVDEKGIRIRWRNLGEGITYHVQMSSDSEFKNILIDEKPDTPLITLQKPEKTGIYFVRTSSIDAKGREGDFSLPQSFEIRHETPYGVLGIIGAFWLIIWLAF